MRGLPITCGSVDDTDILFGIITGEVTASATTGFRAVPLPNVSGGESNLVLSCTCGDFCRKLLVNELKDTHKSSFGRILKIILMCITDE